MGRTQFKVEPGETAHIANGDGSEQEPTFAAPPDENAPALESLDEMLQAEGIAPVKRWMSRARAWFYFRPMDAGAKRDWLNNVVITKADGEPDIARDHMENAIARCLCTAKGDLLIPVDDKGEPTLEGKARLLKFSPQTFEEMWEHVAIMNVLRKQDGEALKNSYAGGTGGATSPSSPASTEPRPSLVT